MQQDGNVLMSKESVQRRWKEYFEREKRQRTVNE